MGKSRRGFTLIELLVVIAIIAILAAILYPVFARAREKGRQASCASNVRSLVMALLQYSDDYGGMMPGDAQYATAIMPYTDGKKLFHCPSHDIAAWSSYTLNCYLIWDVGNNYFYGSGNVKQPSRCALVWDGNGSVAGDFSWYDNGASYYGVSQRHMGLANFGFCDGHVQSVNTLIIRELGLGYNDGNNWVHSSFWPPSAPGTPWADQYAGAQFWVYPEYYKYTD